MRLSKDFTLEELIRTRTGLPNNPTQEEVSKLADLCESVLQPIRDKWGPLHIDSGYRSEVVNSAVGGSRTSQHRRGEAADFVPLEAEIPEVFEWLVSESGIVFGQAISEVSKGIRWIHVSLPTPTHKCQALVFDGIGYSVYS